MASPDEFFAPVGRAVWILRIGAWLGLMASLWSMTRMVLAIFRPFDPLLLPLTDLEIWWWVAAGVVLFTGVIFADHVSTLRDDLHPGCRVWLPGCGIVTCLLLFTGAYTFTVMAVIAAFIAAVRVALWFHDVAEALGYDDVVNPTRRGVLTVLLTVLAVCIAGAVEPLGYVNLPLLLSAMAALVFVVFAGSARVITSHLRAQRHPLARAVTDPMPAVAAPAPDHQAGEAPRTADVPDTTDPDTTDPDTT